MSEDAEKEVQQKPEEKKPVELSDQELEKETGGALNAYLKLRGAKQGSEKGSSPRI